MGVITRTVEEVLAALGTTTHGVVTRRQLLAAGVTPKEIEHRLRTGALIRVHRGVYRVGHRAPSTEALYLAAVWACGDGALLSGRAAAHLQGLVKGPPPAPEVTAPTEREVEGVATRRSSRICLEAPASCRGVPVTQVARTLVDLAAVLKPAELARACHEAGVRHRTTPADVRAVLDREPNAPGAKKLHDVLTGETRVTLSTLERRFLQRLREHGLPLPQTNRRAGSRRVDCRWPQHRLLVELDSYAFHASRHAWEEDRRREREARAAGDEVRRYTYGDVLEHPGLMLAELRALLLPSR